MAPFNFPDPILEQTVTNPITGSVYQWKEPPGKWVVTTKAKAVQDIIYEGDAPPDPRGDYKLWYSTDTLELYFWYEDVNGVGAWVPTSAPITMLEDLDTGLSEVKLGLVEANVAINENTNRIASIVYFGETAPDIYPDVDTGNVVPDGTDEGAPIYEQDERNYKFWLKTDTNELHILRIQTETPRTYAYELISAGAEIPDLQLVLTEGNIADKGIILSNGIDDVLLLTPEECRIMVGGKDGLAPKFELRHTTGVQDTSLVQLELDEDGRRFDIEAAERVNNIQFNFNKDAKLTLNKDGPAVFSSKIIAEDGVLDNEVVTVSQISDFRTDIDDAKDIQDNLVEITSDLQGAVNIALEEQENLITNNSLLTKVVDDALETQDDILSQLEDLGRVRDAGRWRWVSQGSQTSPNQGEFTLLGAAGHQPVRNWEDAHTLVLAAADAGGVRHDIASWDKDDRIEVIGEDPAAGFAVYILGAVVPGQRDTMKHIASCVMSEGNPIDGMFFRIRHFNDATIDIDLADERYVNAAGDDMSGPLNIKGKSATGAVFRQKNQVDDDILVLKQTDDQHSRLDVQANRDFSLYHVGAQKTFIATKNNLLELNYLREPTNGLHAATRNYADTKINSTSGSAKTDITLRGKNKDNGMFNFIAAKPSDWERDTPFGINFDIQNENTYRSRLSFTVRGNETAYLLYKDNTQGTVHKFSGNLYKGAVNTDNKILTEKQIKEIISTEVTTAMGGPARLYWKFEYDSSQNPKAGHFNCSNGNVKNGNVYYFSPTTGNGWSFTVRNSQMMIDKADITVMTFWDTPRNWRYKGSVSVSKVEWTSNGIVKVTAGSQGYAPASLTDGGTYYIALGGIW